MSRNMRLAVPGSFKIGIGPVVRRPTITRGAYRREAFRNGVLHRTTSHRHTRWHEEGYEHCID
jgi:hypothetical protein